MKRLALASLAVIAPLTSALADSNQVAALGLTDGWYCKVGGKGAEGDSVLVRAGGPRPFLGIDGLDCHDPVVANGRLTAKTCYANGGIKLGVSKSYAAGGDKITLDGADFVLTPVAPNGDVCPPAQKAAAVSSPKPIDDFAADPTFIVTTVEKGTLPADAGTMPVPAAAEPIVEAFKDYLSKGCREAGGKPEFKPDFATAVDVNGDGRADIFMTANRMYCDGAVSYWSGSSGSTARWALSKADGTYAIADQLHHNVEIQETLKNGFQLIVHLHGANCNKIGAGQCRHVVNVDRNGEIHTIAWPDGKDRSIQGKPAATASKPAPLTHNLPPADALANSGWSTWFHNGSTMVINEQTGRIVYEEPKASIAGTVPKGAILFEGKFDGKRISGTAYVFKKGCDPAPYQVSGRVEDRKGFGSRIVLTGPAPKRDRNSCAIVGTTATHSRLVFEEYMDI
uniref:Uncharacterized protein n=1 Tax=Bosea sp. NBC_00436 TaxID=2969620 RepID=A0A9E7ZWQ4_9HYPH